jgi:hypothetical protein
MNEIITLLGTLDFTGLVQAGLAVVASGVAFLGALYALFLLIPGEQPDKFIKALYDLTTRISKK